MQYDNLRDAVDAYGGNMKDLTVLAPQNDPFWGGKLNITGQRHLRGLHRDLRLYRLTVGDD